jgi:hypothetical protein
MEFGFDLIELSAACLHIAHCAYTSAFVNNTNAIIKNKVKYPVENFKIRVKLGILSNNLKKLMLNHL